MDEQNTSQEPAKPELDDIFADEKEKTEGDEAAREIVNQEIINQTQAAKQPEPTLDYDNTDVLGKVKKYLIIAAVGLLIILLGGAVYFYRQPLRAGLQKYTGLINSNKPTQPNPSSNQNVPTSTNSPIVNPSQPVGNNNPPPSANKIDSDHDGLTDEEEKALGTNPNSFDTDNDGLFDREEVKVFKTNPLNPDTDGDGFKDGYEVKMKFNPRGPGKLDQMDKQ